MTVTRHSYTGNAPDTTLSAGINSSVTSITIADGTGWPTGSNGPFVVDIDTGESTFEKVLIDSRSGTTLTVNASGRGWDDTSGAAHDSGATIRHVLSAAEIEELNAHAANAAHPHTAAGLGTDSVTTVKIADANVTNDKLAASGLDISKFTTGTSDRDTTGNAATATSAGKWTTARDLTFSGDVTGTLSSVDGSATVDAALTIASDAVDESMIATSGWTSYTPTWTADSSNPAIGNGTLAGAYMELGKLLFFRCHIVMGSTTTYGSGDWILTLPTGKAAATEYVTAAAALRDAGTTTQAGSVKFQNGGLNTFKIATADNNADASTPWTWANGDEVIITGAIEIS